MVYGIEIGQCIPVFRYRNKLTITAIGRDEDIKYGDSDSPHEFSDTLHGAHRSTNDRDKEVDRRLKQPQRHAGSTKVGKVSEINN